MDLPLHPLGLIGDGAALVSGLVIGVGFGAALQIAGMGSARNLVGQFYLTDFRVLKVMFTAIVTALIGWVVLVHLGLLERPAIELQPTILWANGLGGLILGAGFLIGGYCPGTALVGAMSKRWDAVACLAGLFAGVLLVGLAAPTGLPWVAMGKALTVDGILGWSAPVVAGLVAVMAVGAFAGVHWLERKRGPPSHPPSRWAWVLAGGLVVALVATVVTPPQAMTRTAVGVARMQALAAATPERIAASTLADRILAGERFTIVDVRPAGSSALRMGSATLTNPDRMQQNTSSAGRIVLMGADDAQAERHWIVLAAIAPTGSEWPLILDGGLPRWQEQVLYPVLLRQSPLAINRERIDRLARRAEYFGGSPRWVDADTTPAPLPLSPVEPTPSTRPIAQPGARIGSGCR